MLLFERLAVVPSQRPHYLVFTSWMRSTPQIDAGPVTLLNWSFPRKDIPRSHQATQIALALREEVADLQAAGCRILQVDEPALREGLPLKAARWGAYLDWATSA